MEYHNNLTSVLKTLQKSHEAVIRSVCDELNVDDTKADELVAKLLDTSFSSVKPKKDPNRVKKPKSAYLFFCDDKRAGVQAKNPGKKMGDISKVLGELWGNISDKDRAKFQAMHEKDKDRYEKKK